MKKINYILLGLCSLVACNDGDVSFQSMNFSQAEIQSCNGLYFKINGKELLVADFNKGDFSEQLDINAPLNEEQSFQVSNAHPVTYRVYSDNVTNNVLCAAIPPSNPVVTSEYISEPGATVSYKKNMRVVWSNGSAKINYFFDITFHHLTLTKNEEKIKYETYPFGTYSFLNQNLPFSFTNPVVTCGSSTLFQNADADLHFYYPDDLVGLQSVGTHTYPLSSEHYMEYTRYSGTIVDQAPCESKTNEILEQWKATSGVLTVKVETSEDQTSLKKTYQLSNAKFSKDGVNFTVDEVVLKTEIF